MIDVMGIDHAECGFDFFEFLGDPDDPSAYSGENSSIKGLASSADILNLFTCFEKMSMSKAEMDKIAFGNFQRIAGDCLQRKYIVSDCFLPPAGKYIMKRC